MAIENPALAIPVDAAAAAPAAGDDPLWCKDAIIYEAHVKSFFDSNNDGVGDCVGRLSRRPGRTGSAFPSRVC
ncbi:MAG: hypothetical protein ABI868_01940 [Acidobacteriota bacterium]